MALGRVHVWERAGCYYWRVRLPRGLAPRLGRSVVAWSLGTREPREARRRAARATAAFETFAAMLERLPPLRQPTDADLMRLLRDIFDDILVGRDDLSPFSHPRQGRAVGLKCWGQAASWASRMVAAKAAGARLPSAECGRVWL